MLKGVNDNLFDTAMILISSACFRGADQESLFAFYIFLVLQSYDEKCIAHVYLSRLSRVT